MPSRKSKPCGEGHEEIRIIHSAVSILCQTSSVKLLGSEQKTLLPKQPLTARLSEQKFVKNEVQEED